MTSTGGKEIDGLRQRRDELRARPTAIRKDVGRGLNRDSEEQAVELENAEVLDEIARVTQVELDSVEFQLGEASRRAAAAAKRKTVS